MYVLIWEYVDVHIKFFKTKKNENKNKMLVDECPLSLDERRLWRRMDVNYDGRQLR
jgi:hypothetical protein